MGFIDLMGIEDSEVWNYATAVRGIIRTKELNYLDTLRIVDLLGHPNTEMLTKEEYVHHAGCYRRELIARFAVEGFDSDKAVREDADTCMTYNGYIKFLHKDLKHSQLAGEILGQEGAKRRYNDLIQGLALKMIERGRVSHTIRQLHMIQLTRIPRHLLLPLRQNWGIMCAFRFIHQSERLSFRSL